MFRFCQSQDITVVEEIIEETKIDTKDEVSNKDENHTEIPKDIIKKDVSKKEEKKPLEKTDIPKKDSKHTNPKKKTYKPGDTLEFDF